MSKRMVEVTQQQLATDQNVQVGLTKNKNNAYHVYIIAPDEHSRANACGLLRKYRGEFDLRCQRQFVR